MKRLLVVALICVAGCSSDITTQTRDAAPDLTIAAQSEPNEEAIDSSASTAIGSAPLPLGFRRCNDLLTTGVVDGPLSSDSEIAAAQQWRADNGLRSDEAWVVEVPTIANEMPEAGAFDAPLTDEEAMSLFERGNNIDFGALAAYGAQHEETFGGYWLDNTANAPMISFTEDLDERRAELAETLPDVRVVMANASRIELDRLWDRAMSEVTGQGIGTGAGVQTQWGGGVVTLHLFVLDEATIVSVAEFADPAMVCVEGQEVERYTAPGPQAESGDNWRLLALREVDVPFQATFDESAFEQTWSTFDPAEPPPAVDFEREIVVVIPTEGRGVVNGPCGTRFDGWQLVDEVVRLDLPTPGGSTGCDAAWRPGAYLVAITSAEIPAGPVAIEVSSRQRSTPMHSAIFDH